MYISTLVIGVCSIVNATQKKMMCLVCFPFFFQKSYLRLLKHLRVILGGIYPLVSQHSWLECSHVQLIQGPAITASYVDPGSTYLKVKIDGLADTNFGSLVKGPKINQNVGTARHLLFHQKSNWGLSNGPLSDKLLELLDTQV